MSVAVVEEPGWETRGSPTFNPEGVVCHHTGPGSNEALVRLCIRGRSDLPGPLANVVLTTDGVAHVIAAGRANHAGRGGWQGLAENISVFGIEAVHPGDATPWPPVQMAAYERICAGMLRLTPKCNPELVCAHFEWAPLRKIDPIRFHMGPFRLRVRSHLERGDGPTPEPGRVVQPMYDPPLGPLAGVWQDDQNRVLAGVAPDGSVYAWGVPYVGGASGKDYFAGRRAAQIGPRDDGQDGYQIVSTSGEVYRYP